MSWLLHALDRCPPLTWMGCTCSCGCEHFWPRQSPTEFCTCERLTLENVWPHFPTATSETRLERKLTWQPPRWFSEPSRWWSSGGQTTHSHSPPPKHKRDNQGNLVRWRKELLCSNGDLNSFVCLQWFEIRNWQEGELSQKVSSQRDLPNSLYWSSYIDMESNHVRPFIQPFIHWFNFGEGNVT